MVGVGKKKPTNSPGSWLQNFSLTFLLRLCPGPHPFQKRLQAPRILNSIPGSCENREDLLPSLVTFIPSLPVFSKEEAAFHPPWGGLKFCFPAERSRKPVHSQEHCHADGETEAPRGKELIQSPRDNRE